MFLIELIEALIQANGATQEQSSLSGERAPAETHPGEGSRKN